MLKDYFESYEEKGWLDALYSSGEWIEQMELQEQRSFENIIINYFNGQSTTIIMIEDILCDGLGRIIFFHAIGKNIKVARFKKKL